MLQVIITEVRRLESVGRIMSRQGLKLFFDQIIIKKNGTKFKNICSFTDV